jgi:hypothetical protein
MIRAVSSLGLIQPVFFIKKNRKNSIDNQMIVCYNESKANGLEADRA